MVSGSRHRLWKKQTRLLPLGQFVCWRVSSFLSSSVLPANPGSCALEGASQQDLGNTGHQGLSDRTLRVQDERDWEFSQTLADTSHTRPLGGVLLSGLRLSTYWSQLAGSLGAWIHSVD